MLTRRALEFALLLVLAPAALAWAYWARVLPTRTLFPALWLLALIALALLLADRTFDRRQFWNAAAVRPALPRILARFALAALGLTAVLAAVEPQRLLQLPRTNPGLWAVIMLGYPIASVYAQELAFRALFVHRYAPIFRSERAAVWASAIVFGLAHIVMLNPWAVAFTIPGGWLFADTYRRSRSLAAVCVEHALYGCFIFTIGWGYYFYAGSSQR